MSTAKMDPSKAQDFLNDDSFNAMLAAARGETQPEAQAEVSQEPVMEESVEEVSMSENFLPDDTTVSEEFAAEEPLEVKQDYRIPKSRLDEEAKRRYEAEEQVRFLMEQNQKLMEMAKKPAEPEVNPYDDVLDEATFNYVKKLENELNQFKNEYKQRQDQMTLNQVVEQSARQFKAKVADYDDKISNYMKIKNDEAMLMFNDPRQAASYVDQQLEAMTRNAFSQGKDPAEMIYNLASKINGPVAKKAIPTPKGPIPNLDAISVNQKKSATAPTNNAATVNEGLPSKVLTADMKEYFTNEAKFNELLNKARKAQGLA